MTGTSRALSSAATRPSPAVAHGKSDFLLWVFIGYLVVEYVRPQYYVPVIGVVRPGLLFSLILAGFSLSKGIELVKKSRILQLCTAFVLMTIIWVPFAVNNYAAYIAAKGMTLHLLAAVVPLVLLADSKDRLAFVIRFWVGVTVYVAIFALTHAGRGPGSFIGDENDVALFLLTGLPFIYYTAQEAGAARLRKWSLYGALVIVTLGIAATNSRGGFVGLVAVVCGLIWFSRYRVRALLSLCLIGAIATPFIQGRYIDEIQSIEDTQDRTRLDRLHLWQMGWLMFKDNPVLGVGPRNYPWRVHEYERMVPLEERLSRKGHGGRVAHSLYLTLLPEFGLVGGVIFGYIALLIASTCRRIAHKSGADDYVRGLARAVLVALGGYLIAGVFITVLYYPQFWLLAGLTVALSTLASASPVRRRVAAQAEIRYGQTKGRTPGPD